jgi:hypothetical protein
VEPLQRRSLLENPAPPISPKGESGPESVHSSMADTRKPCWRRREDFARSSDLFVRSAGIYLLSDSDLRACRKLLFVRRISTEKRLRIDWSGQLPAALRLVKPSNLPGDASLSFSPSHLPLTSNVVNFNPPIRQFLE